MVENKFYVRYYVALQSIAIVAPLAIAPRVPFSFEALMQAKQNT